MTLTPLVLGKGRAGQAIAKSMACISVMRPELNLAPPVWLERGSSLAEARKGYEKAILCIANPHGLHADAILEADRAGYAGILCEKPACVNLTELERLRRVRTPTAVLHVYRQMWGPQKIKEMLVEGQFGELITIEGRYWQASTAERALSSDKSPSWKDDPRLSGEYDAFLDVATHWVDAASFLIGDCPSRVTGWRSYANANAPHRDSHLQLTLDYAHAQALVSVSKTVHGAMNHFEINLIGTKMSATWEFMKPDEIVIGEGRDRRVLTRKTSKTGSHHPPHHGMGWLEGYVEIVSRLLAEIEGQARLDYPNLADNLDLLAAMFRAEWR